MADAQRPIVLGCPLPQDFIYGQTAIKGITLAVEEINGKGGVRVGTEMRPFKVQLFNTMDLEPKGIVFRTLIGVERLILEENADFIIGGPVRSEVALAVMPTLSMYKKVSIVSSGVLTPRYHQTIKEEYEKYKYCFRIHGEAGQLIKEMMEVLGEIRQKFGLSKIFVMAQDVEHAIAGGEGLRKVAGTKGFEVKGFLKVPTGTKDFSNYLEEAKKSGAQILNIWMDMPESSILTRQWYDMKIKLLPFGSTFASAERPDFWESTKGKGEFTIANVVNAGNVPSNATDWTMRFYRAYKERFKTEPEALGASSSYMAVYVLKDAIERAGSLDSERMINALELTDMMGVYGRIRFDRQTHQVVPALDPKEGAVGSIFQWQEGKRVVVFPKSIATGEIKLPPWMTKQ
jgi:branched-chain amino acid transport system substrate-binding protein